MATKLSSPSSSHYQGPPQISSDIDQKHHKLLQNIVKILKVNNVLEEYRLIVRNIQQQCCCKRTRALWDRLNALESRYKELNYPTTPTTTTNTPHQQRTQPIRRSSSSSSTNQMQIINNNSNANDNYDGLVLTHLPRAIGQKYQFDGADSANKKAKFINRQPVKLIPINATGGTNDNNNNSILIANAKDNTQYQYQLHHIGSSNGPMATIGTSQSQQQASQSQKPGMITSFMVIDDNGEEVNLIEEEEIIEDEEDDDAEEELDIEEYMALSEILEKESDKFEKEQDAKNKMILVIRDVNTKEIICYECRVNGTCGFLSRERARMALHIGKHYQQAAEEEEAAEEAAAEQNQQRQQQQETEDQQNANNLIEDYGHVVDDVLDDDDIDPEFIAKNVDVSIIPGPLVTTNSNDSLSVNNNNNNSSSPDVQFLYQNIKEEISGPSTTRAIVGQPVSTFKLFNASRPLAQQIKPQQNSITILAPTTTSNKSITTNIITAVTTAPATNTKNQSTNMKQVPVNALKPIRCEWEGCTFMCDQNYKLRTHVRQVHEKIRPYLCDWPGCFGAYKTRSNLASHKMVHTGERPYLCDYPKCGAKFARKYDCERHRRIHSEKMYPCEWPGCGKRLCDPYNLERHMMVHKGELPYRCPLNNCVRGFRELRYLRDHMVNTHKILPDTNNLRMVCAGSPVKTVSLLGYNLSEQDLSGTGGSASGGGGTLMMSNENSNSMGSNCGNPDQTVATSFIAAIVTNNINNRAAAAKQQSTETVATTSNNKKESTISVPATTPTTTTTTTATSNNASSSINSNCNKKTEQPQRTISTRSTSVKMNLENNQNNNDNNQASTSAAITKSEDSDNTIGNNEDNNTNEENDIENAPFTKSTNKNDVPNVENDNNALSSSNSSTTTTISTSTTMTRSATQNKRGSKRGGRN